MSAKCIVVAGMTGTGKTTFVKNNILSKVPVSNQLVFDVNGEYSGHGTFDDPNIESFMSYAQTQTNKVIVFEEATIFFSQHGVKRDLFNFLVKKRHMNNTLVFVFHSLRKIPQDILDMTDFVVVLRTNDRPGIVYERFKDNPEIIDAYEAVNNSGLAYDNRVVPL